MKSIHKYITVNSDTLYIPELKQFFGKRVELSIKQENLQKSEKYKMKHFFDAIGKIEIDENAVHQLRERSIS